MSKIYLADCTDKCQSTQHGDAITSAITKRGITDTDLCIYLTYTCCCCESVKDSVGRTALHVAASCGRTELVRWLIQVRNANINLKDRESGYTALHRSIFYGKIDTAVELMKLGASLGIQDANGLTYLEHAMFDCFGTNSNCNYGELFTWGVNANNSLGSQQSRMVPEVMDIFHKEYPNEDVNKVLINQFHSVILTNTGSVYSCGHGHGGRLGLGIQHTEMIPRQIKFQTPSNLSHTSERIQISQCAIARDHSLFLSSVGVLYSCGLNKHRVLGLTPPPSEILVPKPLKQINDEFLFITCGNYHSVAWNKTGLYTWGLNAGQLGHHLHNVQEEKYIFTPKKVKSINLTDNSIKLVAANTGATVVYTEKGDIYVLHEYQCRKIASRQLNLVDISIVGGKLNHALDPELSNKTREFKVAALTNTGNLLLWQESDPLLRRCIFSLNRALCIKQIYLNNTQILFVTKDGEAFKGEIKTRRKKIVNIENNITTKSEFHKFLEKDECVLVKVDKFPRIYRAINIQSDPKGQDFAVIQEHPYKHFENFNITESTMADNMKVLLENADEEDNIVDVVFNIGGRQFFAHKYILASRSNYFAILFSKYADANLELKGHPDIFRQLLQFIYTNTCELIETGEIKSECLRRLCKKTVLDSKENVNTKVKDSNLSAFEHYSGLNNSKENDNSNETKIENPVRMLHEMAKRFEVISLQKILSKLDLYKYSVRLKKDCKEILTQSVVFDKAACQDLYDVEITCKDDRVLKAHKCILAARLDYFSSMFSTRWGGKELSKINIPFSKGVVEALLEYVYTDSLHKLKEREVDHLFKIMILADQFFVLRMKDQCEKILSDLISIKNAVQLLTFADTYNAESLKENCFSFMCQNVSSFLEMRLFEELDPHLLKEFSDFYQIKQHLECRIITPYSVAVTDKDIADICLCDVNISEKKDKTNRGTAKISNKKRVRSHKLSSSEKPSVPNEINPANNELLLLDDTEVEAKTFPDGHVANRLKAIKIANKRIINEEIEENFSSLNISREDNLSKSFVDDFQFPLLTSPPKPSGFQNKPTHRTDLKNKIPKLSQKQRKRLSSEGNDQVLAASPTLAESPKNPWKIIQPTVSPVISPKNDNIGSIMSSEKLQKVNLVKIKSKLLTFTQLEDRAIEELRKFYSVDSMEDEIIEIERVSIGAIALPVWVPKTK